MGERRRGVAVAGHPPCLLIRGWMTPSNDASIGALLAFPCPSNTGTRLASSVPRRATVFHADPARRPRPAQRCFTDDDPGPAPGPGPAPRPAPAPGDPAPGTRRDPPPRPRHAVVMVKHACICRQPSARPVPACSVFHGKRRASGRRSASDGHLRGCLQERPFLAVEHRPEGVCPDRMPEARETPVERGRRALPAGTGLATRARQRGS